MAQGRRVNKLVLSIVMATTAGSLATPAEAESASRKFGTAATGQTRTSAGVAYLPKRIGNNKKLDRGIPGLEYLPKSTGDNNKYRHLGVSYLPKSTGNK
jgi:hypothetical protein